MSQANIDFLKSQILGQGTTSQWSGQGFGSAEANAADMAKILDGIGITNINQFGELPTYTPVTIGYYNLNGNRVSKSGNNYYVSEWQRYGEDGGYLTRKLSAAEAKIAEQNPVYGTYSNPRWWEGNEPEFNPVDSSKVIIKDGKPVYQSGVTYGNKVTGQSVPSTYGERQVGNAWGGTFAGSGNTGYRVQFDANGNPYFYTTGASSSDLADLMPLIQIGLMAIPGVGTVLGTSLGASGLAATTIGNAIIGGALAEASGGDFAQGALAGGAGALAGGYIAPELSATLGSETAGRAITGGLLSEAKGGDFLQGAVSGAVSGAVDDAKLAAAEEYLASQPSGYGAYESNLPTEQSVLDAIAAEQPTSTSFTPDYSLNIEAPIVQDMGAQGVVAPTINDVVEVLSSPVNYEIAAQTPEQLTVSAPSISDMGSAQGIITPETDQVIDYSPVQQEVFIPDTTFTPDYSLTTGAPVIQEMGGQGIQVPTISEVVDVVSQPVDYSLPIPESGLDLTMPTAPNIESMGGGQGITVPVSGGILTESGVIPESYTPVLGDETSFINQPVPDSGVTIPEVVETPMTADELLSKMTMADLVKTLGLTAANAYLANKYGQPTQEEQVTGFGIVPAPEGWRSPVYNQAFTPSAPIDFGSPELLKGTQWENPVNLSDLINVLNRPMQVPGYEQPVVQMPTVGMTDIIGNLGGSPVSIADIISGIQSGQNYIS